MRKQFDRGCEAGHTSTKRKRVNRTELKNSLISLALRAGECSRAGRTEMNQRVSSPVWTHSRSRPLIRLMVASSLSLQRGSGAPEMNQLLPLSASSIP